MTVLDTSAAIDYLLDDGVAGVVHDLLVSERIMTAPDLIVFEVLAVLRRDVLRGDLDRPRAHAAIADLGDLSVQLYPSMPLRVRAWQLRDNLTAADGLFVALAEHLSEPLATKDAGLAAAARDHTGIEVIHLGGAP